MYYLNNIENGMVLYTESEERWKGYEYSDEDRCEVCGRKIRDDHYYDMRGTILCNDYWCHKEWAEKNKKIAVANENSHPCCDLKTKKEKLVVYKDFWNEPVYEGDEYIDIDDDIVPIDTFSDYLDNFWEY